MKLEITCDLGTIRMSDRRLTVGDAQLSDVLGELVGALKSVTEDEHVILSKGEFGFRPPEADIDPDPDEDEDE